MPLDYSSILRFFKSGHLPGALQPLVGLFEVVAETIAKEIAPSEETTDCLRMLLKSKDAAVRARILMLEAESPDTKEFKERPGS